jgi:hypothetical protein
VIVIVGESKKATDASTLLFTEFRAPASSTDAPTSRLVDVEKFELMLETSRNCGASMYRRRTTLSSCCSLSTWLTALL